MSKIFVKILDASLIPASIMIVAKLIGLYITVKIFNINWGILTTSNAIISSRPVLEPQNLQIVSSYSDLFLILVMLFGFSLQVFRAVYLHDTHVKPKIVSHLAVHGLLHLIKDSFEVYRKATVWLIFLWLTNVSVFINFLSNKTYFWVFLISFITSFILSVILLNDASHEIHIAKLKAYEK